MWTEYLKSGILYEELVSRDWTVSFIAVIFVETCGLDILFYTQVYVDLIGSVDAQIDIF